MAKVKMPNVKRFVRSFSQRLDKNISKAEKSEIETEIIATILSGQSPVEGKKFKPYSRDYAKRFKNGERLPVDMNQTGKMLDSLKVSQIRGKTGISIEFDSQIAIYHDRTGAGRSRVIRRLLPRTREKFIGSIQKVINAFFKRNVRKSVR